MDKLKELKQAWTRCLTDTPESEIVKNDLRYYVNTTSHTPGDAYTTAFKDGQRMLAVAILQLVEEK